MNVTDALAGDFRHPSIFSATDGLNHLQVTASRYTDEIL